MQYSPEDWARISNCPLLAGLSGEAASDALSFFSARMEDYRKGEFLIRVGDPVRRFGLVLEGTIQVFADDIRGHHMIMASVPPGGIFGEALCFLRVQEAPIYICAMRFARVLWMHTDRLFAPLEEPFAAELSRRYTAMLSQKLLDMNDRVQVLSKQRLRDKLITFFSQCARRQGSRSFEIPFDRANLAAFLGVNRSALSRELSKMREEGLIAFEKNRFTVFSRERC